VRGHLAVGHVRAAAVQLLAYTGAGDGPARLLSPKEEEALALSEGTRWCRLGHDLGRRDGSAGMQFAGAHARCAYARVPWAYGAGGMPMPGCPGHMAQEGAGSRAAADPALQNQSHILGRDRSELEWAAAAFERHVALPSQ